MQLTDAAACEWVNTSQILNFEPEHLYDPETNTLAGCFYLAKMLESFPACDDPTLYALASYNAGKSQVNPGAKAPSPPIQLNSLTKSAFHPPNGM